MKFTQILENSSKKVFGSFTLDLSHSLFDSCSISSIEKFTVSDRCEIRTRATEVTGALNQRLRPLGQPTMSHEQLLAGVVARVRQHFPKTSKNFFRGERRPLAMEYRLMYRGNLDLLDT